MGRFFVAFGGVATDASSSKAYLTQIATLRIAETDNELAKTTNTTRFFVKLCKETSQFGNRFFLEISDPNITLCSVTLHSEEGKSIIFADAGIVSTGFLVTSVEARGGFLATSDPDKASSREISTKSLTPGGSGELGGDWGGIGPDVELSR